MNTLVEEMQYSFYDSTEISKKQSEITNFLLNLTEERKTLYRSDEINEEEYPEICNNAVSRIGHIVLASHGDQIVGMSAGVKLDTNIILRMLPLWAGFIVVKSEYQGRGIGQKLTDFHTMFTKNMWCFWIEITRIENKAMLRILENDDEVVFVGKDDRFVYGFSPNRSELKIFNPFIHLLLRLFKVETPRIKKIYNFIAFLVNL